MQHLRNQALLSGVLIVLLLSSCSSSPQKLNVKSEQVQVPKQKYDRPSGVVAPDINVVVITPERAQVWSEKVADGDMPPYVYFSYDEKDYLTYAQWLQDLLRYIKHQNAVIDSYERDVDFHNSAINKESKPFNKK